jgi:ABC-2 type transport system permease protein
MANLLTITRREIGAFFGSPIFWVLATAFMVFSGFVFSIIVTRPGAQADMLPLLGLYGTVLLFVAPLMSMRLLAEEQRSGTLELLMTSPVDDWQVVWGKWLGALFMLGVIIALTLFHVAVMLRLATEGIDVGPLAGSYLGLVLLGAALLAIGVLTSSVTQNQVVAGFLAIMAVLILWFLPLGEQVFGSDSALGSTLGYLGLSDHYFNFGQGLIDSRDVVYMLSLIAGSLFLATRILESRRWR